MIFDKNLDKALWLLLSADRKNSEKVVNFINIIPEELKEQIQEKIKIYNEYKMNGNKNFSFLCGDCEIDNKLLFWFEIDTYFGELEMGYMESNCGIYKDVFKMTLLLDENLSLIDNFGKKNIGRIEYDIHTNKIDNVGSIVESSENSYDLYKTPLGYMIVYSVDNDKGVKHYMKIINILDMPEELFIDDIKDMSDVKRLVKERKRK